MIEEFSMRPLITAKHKHLLCKDELGDDFLLTKYGEIFKYSENVLRVQSFLKRPYSHIKKLGLILEELQTDDPLWVFNVEKANLGLLIALGTHKRRPHRNGKWFRKAEERLAHNIFPYKCPDYWEKQED